MRYILLLLAFLAIPLASALQITEIMYDCPGTDSGFEWIEIYNDGEELDLCSFRLYEAETNHYIKGEDCTLASGKYVILADKLENLEFDSMLDSAFSLSNTGEELCIRDAEKNDIDCVAYSSAQGAAGDGKSLQLVGGEWLAAEPTPGCENAEQEDESEQQEEEGDEQEDEEEEQEEAEDKQEEQEQKEKKEGVENEREELEKDEPLDLAKSYKDEQTEPKVAGAVVYESDAQKSSSAGILMLLAVSITLNAVFLVSSIRRTK